MQIRHLTLLVLYMCFPFISAQDFLDITEQVEKKHHQETSANTAKAIFVATSPNYIVSSSNKSVDVFSEPIQNEQGTYEYEVTLNLSGGHPTRHFRVEKKKTTLFGETEQKIVFASGEVRYFTISEPEIKICHTKSIDKRLIDSRVAQIEISAPQPGLEINSSPSLPCQIETKESENNTYLTTISIDKSKLANTHSNNVSIDTLYISYKNSNIIPIYIGGIESGIKQRYTIINCSCAFPDDEDFQCGSSVIKDIDGNTYTTVQIGTQCWLRENLRTTKYANGTEIDKEGIFNNGNALSYGFFYTWYATMGYDTGIGVNQGVCPNGWHVPGDGEWQILAQYLERHWKYCCRCSSSNTNIAKSLASPMGWLDCTYDCSIGNKMARNNASGFSAVPAGFYSPTDKKYDEIGNQAIFWSATEIDQSKAYTRTLENSSKGISRENKDKRFGFSVRCVKN